ncbi:MAG: ribbon-helix-helix domain-containing protein [Lachnospiraceae bacterium]|nr:ribbon-helix-helix domain-containing protein [Lachnospiraceae bacterium]
MFREVKSLDDNRLKIPVKSQKGEDGYKVFSIRIKEDLVEEIDVLSEQTGRSRNELIGRLLRYALDKCDVVKN